MPDFLKKAVKKLAVFVRPHAPAGVIWGHWVNVTRLMTSERSISTAYGCQIWKMQLVQTLVESYRQGVKIYKQTDLKQLDCSSLDTGVRGLMIYAFGMFWKCVLQPNTLNRHVLPSYNRVQDLLVPDDLFWLENAQAMPWACGLGTGKSAFPSSISCKALLGFRIARSEMPSGIYTIHAAPALISTAWTWQFVWNVAMETPLWKSHSISCLSPEMVIRYLPVGSNWISFTKFRCLVSL